MNARDRRHVFLAVYRVLAAVAPDDFSGLRGRASPGGVRHVNKHPDALIGIARGTTANSLEPYLAGVREDVCAHCQFQYPSGYCSLRSMNACVLNRHADRIFPAIATALAEVGDEEYLRNHPAGSGSAVLPSVKRDGAFMGA